MNQIKRASLILCLILPLGCTLDLSDYPELSTDVGLNSSDEPEPANGQNDSSVADIHVNTGDMADVNIDASVTIGSGHLDDSHRDDIDADPSDAGNFDGGEHDANDVQADGDVQNEDASELPPDACPLGELPIADVPTEFHISKKRDRGVVSFPP